MNRQAADQEKYFNAYICKRICELIQNLWTLKFNNKKTVQLKSVQKIWSKPQ